eukprot:1456787-Rhodomonas_salina.2
MICTDRRTENIFVGSVDRKDAQAECPGTDIAPFPLSSGVQSEEELRDAKWVVWMVPNGNGTARFRIATVEQFSGGGPLRQHAGAMYGAASALRTACKEWGKSTFYDPKNANGEHWAKQCSNTFIVESERNHQRALKKYPETRALAVKEIEAMVSEHKQGKHKQVAVGDAAAALGLSLLCGGCLVGAFLLGRSHA